MYLKLQRGYVLHEIKRDTYLREVHTGDIDGPGYLRDLSHIIEKCEKKERKLTKNLVKDLLAVPQTAVPANPGLGIRPEQVAEQPFVGDVDGPGYLQDLPETLQLRADAAVHAKNLVLHDCCHLITIRLFASFATAWVCVLLIFLTTEIKNNESTAAIATLEDAVVWLVLIADTAIDVAVCFSGHRDTAVDVAVCFQAEHCDTAVMLLSASRPDIATSGLQPTRTPQNTACLLIPNRNAGQILLEQTHTKDHHLRPVWWSKETTLGRVLLCRHSTERASPPLC